VTVVPSSHLLLFAAVCEKVCSIVVNVCSQGTVIRVFSVPDGQKLFEFRRGVKRYLALHLFWHCHHLYDYGFWFMYMYGLHYYHK